MRIRFESQAPDADRPSSGPGGRPLGAAHPMRRRASAAQIVAQPRLTPLRLVGELFHTLRPIAYGICRLLSLSLSLSVCLSHSLVCLGSCLCVRACTCVFGCI